VLRLGGKREVGLIVRPGVDLASAIRPDSATIDRSRRAAVRNRRASAANSLAVEICRANRWTGPSAASMSRASRGPA
jgi:hypothetical protein